MMKRILRVIKKIKIAIRRNEFLILIGSFDWFIFIRQFFFGDLDG